MPDPTVEEFCEEFVEFSTVEASVIRAAIASASRRTPESVWQEYTREGLLWLAAHLVSGDPEGAEMRIEDPSKTLSSFYLEQRRELEGIIGVGGDIAGGPSCFPLPPSVW